MRAGSYRQSLLRNDAPGCTRCEIGEIHGTDESNQMVWTDSCSPSRSCDDSDPGVGVRAVAADVHRAGDSAAHRRAGAVRKSSSVLHRRDHRARAHRGHRQAPLFSLRHARRLAAATRRWILVSATGGLENVAQPFCIQYRRAPGRYRAPVRSAVRSASAGRLEAYRQRRNVLQRPIRRHGKLDARDAGRSDGRNEAQRARIARFGKHP